MQNLDTGFRDIFEKLNKEQRKAVETIDGPVMVIAGPGTGKTQILASRILNIIQQDDCKPENILCLTYTDAGATAMRKRLSEFMGTESYKVNIHTFHSLCNRLISERPDLYSKRELRVMDELERLELFQSIIEALPHHSPLKEYESFNTNLHWQLHTTWTVLRELQIDSQWISQEVERLKDPEIFKETFPDLCYKRNTTHGKKGDIKPKDHQALFEHWERLIEVATLYPEYQQKKAALGVYEFSDMLDWVYERLKSDEDYKLSIQERFLYVLVDEFQDTSYQQGEILRLLTDYWGDQANCFVVGDDDQSIYAFQGARVGNMIEFKNRYSDTLRTIVLTENYRSSQPILDAATQLISHNKHRLVHTEKGLSKNLHSAGENRDYEPLIPEIDRYRNEFHEILGVTEKIQGLLEKGVNPSDIAILYAKHRFADGFIELFREKNIPFLLNKQIDILTEPIVGMALHWLNYLHAELTEAHSGESQLYAILASEMYPFRPMALNQLSSEIYAIKMSRKRENLPSYSWREHLLQIAEDPSKSGYLTSEESGILVRLFQYIEDWIKKVATLNLGALISQMFSEFGFIHYATKNPDSHWQLEVLHTFISYVNQQCERFPFIHLAQLLNQLETLKNAKIEIPLEKRIGVSQGIQLFSAHGSKGLEFDHVFVIRCLENEWNGSATDKFPFKLRTLFEAVKGPILNEETQSQAMEERRRLFFVAITRAKKTLHLSYYDRKLTDKNDSLIPSVFLGEMQPDYFQNGSETVELKETALAWAQKQILLKKGEPTLEIDANDWVEDRIQKFVFSPSSIQSILKCGITFFYQHIVRVPSSSNEYLSYGNAMHACMRHFVEHHQKTGNWLNIEECQAYFEFQMHRMKGSFTEKQFESRITQGRNILEFLIPQKTQEFSQYEKVFTELPVHVDIDGVLIKGNIDKLVVSADGSYISDYKTGKIKNIKEKSKVKVSIKEGDLPNDYWLQVGIYVMMVNAHKDLNISVTKGRIEALTESEDHVFETIDLYYGPEHFDILKDIIKRAQHALVNKDFYHGCGKDHCEWCSFSKQRGFVTLIQDEELEDV